MNECGSMRINYQTKISPVLDLLLEMVAEDARGVLGEAVDSGGDGGFVGEIPRDPPFVLRPGATDERRVEDQPVLGSVSFGLQRPEKGRGVELWDWRIVGCGKREVRRERK